jgi:hypothetical protein
LGIDIASEIGLDHEFRNRLSIALREPDGDKVPSDEIDQVTRLNAQLLIWRCAYP